MLNGLGIYNDEDKEKLNDLLHEENIRFQNWTLTIPQTLLDTYIHSTATEI